MFDLSKIIGGLVKEVFGSETPAGTSQFLELLKGKGQKEREFQMKLEQMYQERIELEIKDLQSARAMQIEALKQNDVFAKRFVYYLSAGLITAAIAANFVPFFVNIPSEMTTMANRSTDFLNYVAATSVITFYFGAKTQKNDKKH